MTSLVLKQVISAYPHPEKLKIRDLNRVGSLIDAIISSGPHLFQLITDFDFTMTKTRLEDGRKGESGPGVLTHSPLMTQEFRDKSLEMFNKYHPFEIDHQISLQQKIKGMEEWYEKRRELIVSAGITKSLITQMVEICDRVALREGLKEALERLTLFMESFDVVLVDDQTFDFVNLLLTHLLNKSESK